MVYQKNVKRLLARFKSYRTKLFATALLLSLSGSVVAFADGQSTRRTPRDPNLTSRSPAVEPSRRASTRSLPVKSQPAPVKKPPTQAIQNATFSGDFAEDDSVDVVVQANCPNCNADGETRISVGSSDPLDAGQDYVDESQSDEHRHWQSTDSSCDANCSQSSAPLHYFGLGGCGIAVACDPCSPLAMLSQRLYLRAEAASFWGSGQFLPALVSTSVGQPLLPVDDAGLPNDPNRRVLFGGSEVGTASSQGVRFEAGLWVDACQSRGILFRMFDSGDNDLGLTTDNTQNAVLARNFLDVGPPREQSLVSIAYPGIATGSVNANLSSSVYGGDLLWRSNICRDSLGRWDWVGGYQMARLDESLDIVSRTNDQAAPQPILDQQDHFRARNNFHGGTLGVHGEVRDGCWYFGGLFKLGIGEMERQVDIAGSSTVTIGDDVSTQDQGLLARRTNDGSFSNSTAVVVPEIGLTIGYRLTSRLDFTVGYNLLRLPKVGRVVDALDRELASNLSDPLVGDVRPVFAFRETNFSLHSLNLGLQWAY